MVTRCPPCGVERIGSRSPGALGLFWDTESTAPGRSSPRPRTASPYPTMWSLPFVVFVRRFRFVRIALFNFFMSFVVFFGFFSWPCKIRQMSAWRVVGGRGHTRSAEQCGRVPVIVHGASQYSRIFVQSIRRNDVETEERDRRDINRIKNCVNWNYQLLVLLTTVM